MTASQIAGPGAWRESTGLDAVLRYGGSTCGPMAVSAAHFLASLIFLHDLPAQAFGLFSFVMVTLSFGMSLNLSLVCVPITRSVAIGDRAARSACFQMNWLVCIGLLGAMIVNVIGSAFLITTPSKGGAFGLAISTVAPHLHTRLM